MEKVCDVSLDLSRFVPNRLDGDKVLHIEDAPLTGNLIINRSSEIQKLFLRYSGIAL